MKLFDTHVHLNDKRFCNDIQRTIENAQKAEVAVMLNVSYNQRSIAQTDGITKKYSFIYGAVGLHPHYVKDTSASIFDEMRKCCENKKIVAIGEIGLDYYRDLSPRNMQKEWFVKQIELAKELKKPIIVHNRESNEDSVEIIKSTHAGEYGGVVHSFSGDTEMLKVILNENMHISVNGISTYKSAHLLKQVIKAVPMEHLLIETDCPYLTPDPFRGGRNEPAYVKIVAEAVAEVKKISVEEVARITTQNACKLFEINFLQD